MQIKQTLIDLCSVMSVTGFESTGEKKLEELILPYFDEMRQDNAGNHIFIRKCGKPGAKKVLIDTHFDEIGMMVKGFCPGGFLRICRIGGIDARILQGSEVIVYGKKAIPAVVCCVPDHLKNPEDINSVTDTTYLFLDTGYSDEELKKTVSLGDPVGFKPDYRLLGESRLSGKGFDDKACAVCAVRCLELLKDDELDCDIYFCMTAKEEVNQKGSDNAAFSIMPDMAIAVDVCFAMAPEEKPADHKPLGAGPVISYSITTDRALAKRTVRVAEESGIPHNVIAEGGSTSTNADTIPTVRDGIPTVLISLPLLCMHSAVEILCETDVENTARLIAEVIRDAYGRGDGK